MDNDAEDSENPPPDDDTPANAPAKVAELVDAQDLGSCGVTRESSSLSFRTKPQTGILWSLKAKQKLGGVRGSSPQG